MDHRVNKVIALMKEYLHKGWPASKLARSVNISPSRLHQLFKDETGLPPAKYLHLLRMERARELLENSYLSVKEVMACVGFNDASHFPTASHAGVRAAHTRIGHESTSNVPPIR